jgi:hypothetical protein
MFQADHRFDGKPYKKFVAIFITDGEDIQYTQVQSEATAAHAEDIVTISIGKTDVFQSLHHIVPNQITAKSSLCQLVILDYHILILKQSHPTNISSYW